MKSEKQKLLEATCGVFGVFGRDRLENNVIKSERSLEKIPEDKNDERDIQITSNVQNFMFKKMSEIIERKFKYECKSENKPICEDADVNLIKLLHEANNFIGATNALDLGAAIRKKPVIKRRNVDPEINEEESEKLKSVVVSSEYIERAKDIHYWAPRKQRKIFYYKLKNDGKLHAIK